MAEAHPLQRLASGKDEAGQAFLEAYHLEAATQLALLVERAHLGPRVTMSYDPARIGGQAGPSRGAGDISERAADARVRLNRLAGALPSECWGVAFDVCALGKGLQVVELERQWPRRSAKLVLRIALEQLAALMGLAPHRAGMQGGRTRNWLEERLPLIADDET